MTYLENLSTDTPTRTLQLLESIARELGLLPPLVSDDPPLPTVTVSIGTTARDYSTITLFEADLDNTTPYDAGDDVVGECYDDSDFSESVTFDGGGTLGLNSVRLTAAAGHRHDGTGASGVVNDAVAANANALFTFSQNTPNLVIEWLILKGWQLAGGGARFGIRHTSLANTAATYRNCILDGESVAASVAGAAFDLIRDNANILNNIVLNVTVGDGLIVASSAEDTEVYNNTFYNCQTGIDNDETTITFKNNISVGASGNDYESAGGTWTHNLDEDGTAPGTDTQTDTPANLFVSTVGGSEDLHLKTGAAAIDAGTDLGTTPTGINLDIDGRDRDAEGDTWDIGADEFVDEGGGGGLALAIASYHYRHNIKHYHA